MKINSDTVRDCSRQYLEAAIDNVAARVEAGEIGLIPHLQMMRVQLPHAPDYELDYRGRQ